VNVSFAEALMAFALGLDPLFVGSHHLRVSSSSASRCRSSRDGWPLSVLMLRRSSKD
jgi:hypothetical protein